MADSEKKEDEAASADGAADSKDGPADSNKPADANVINLHTTDSLPQSESSQSNKSEVSDSAKSETESTKSETESTKAETGDANANVSSEDHADASGSSTSGAAKSQKMTQHHVSNILDEVLEQPKLGTDKHGYKHPMVLDLILAAGLLVAMGGFTIGLINIYITHQAEQSIMQRNYRAAITVLKGAPLAGFFTMPGADPADLLNQALYLDAMERLDANGEDETALKDLEKIQAGSRYFDIAQEILKEHFKPSDRQLEGKAEHDATPEEAQPPKKPILPPAETDATP